VELDDKLKRERALRQKYAPSNRNRLVESLEEAKQRGDDAKASELQEQLDSLETPRLAWKTSLTPAKKVGPSSQQERLAQLNIENRRRNAEAVRKAQLKEKAKARESMVRGEDVAANDNASGAQQTPAKSSQATPTTERKSTPLNGSGVSTPANGTLKMGTTSSIPVHIAKLQQNTAGADKKGLPQIHRPIMDDDIIGSLDLELDVDI
jgi:RNA polymerase-associated protein RTF1